MEIRGLFGEGPAREDEIVARSEERMTLPERWSINRVDLIKAQNDELEDQI